MESRQGVDGYGPGEYDGFHWEHALAALATAALAVFLILLLNALGAPVLLLLAPVLLFALVVESCYVSSFWRRYHYLVWWRQLLIILAGLPLFAVKAMTVNAVIALLSTPQNSYPDYQRTVRRLGGDVEHPMAADKDGNVFEWNCWRGVWEARPGFQGAVSWELKKTPLDPSLADRAPQEKVPDPYEPERR